MKAMIILILFVLIGCGKENQKTEIIYLEKSSDSLETINEHLNQELKRCNDENQIFGSMLGEYEINKNYSYE